MHITGCSAGEQYSHWLFSRVLLGAQVGGLRGWQQSGLGREQTRNNQGLVLNGATDSQDTAGRDSVICWDSKRAIHRWKDQEQKTIYVFNLLTVWVIFSKLFDRDTRSITIQDNFTIYQEGGTADRKVCRR